MTCTTLARLAGAELGIVGAGIGIDTGDFVTFVSSDDGGTVTTVAAVVVVIDDDDDNGGRPGCGDVDFCRSIRRCCSLLLVNLSFRCARMWALKATRSLYLRPQIVQVASTSL